MNAATHKAELAVNTLELSELLMQFKVMKALGYHSLFDENFKRELRNPLRKVLYYKLIMAEESIVSKFQGNLLKSMADRIGFFCDPELAKKVAENEERSNLQDPHVAQNVLDTKNKAYEEALKKHVVLDEGTLQKIQETLSTHG